MVFYCNCFKCGMTVAQGLIYSDLAYEVLHGTIASRADIAERLKGDMWCPIRLRFNQILRDTGVSEPTAYRSMAKLREMGYLTKDKVNVNPALHSRFFSLCELPEDVSMGMFEKVLYFFLRANSGQVDDGVRLCTDRRVDLVEWLGCGGQNYDLTIRKLEKKGYIKRCDGAIRLVDLYYCLKIGQIIKL